jgi:hypothetical protein
MEPVGIALDINVIMTSCLNRKSQGFSPDFIYFLEEHHNLGLITTRMEHRILKQLKDSGRQNTYYRFYEIKEHLKPEKVDSLEYEKMRETVKDFFHRLGSSKVYLYNPFNELGLEDVERLAEVALIKPRYEVLYFASLDSDFVSSGNSKAIENKFKVKADYPINILNKVKPII